MEPSLEERIREAARLLQSYGATAVYVFGSATRDRLRDESDVDLAVEGLPPSLFFRAVAGASRVLGRPADLVLLDAEDGIGEQLRRSGELARVA